MVSAMWGGEWDIHWLDEVGSTNTYVRDRARQEVPEGLVAVAEHQTAGRGRLDRHWESPPGANLLASVLLRPDCGGDDVHLCAGAVALAGADACREVAGLEPVLKWPNDLLLDGAKLAGVLAETEFSGPSLTAVVVGIGINVAWPGPEEAGGTCLDCNRGGEAQPVDRKVLLDHLLSSLGPRCALLEQAGGRRALAEEVRRRCATLGQQVRVVLAGEELIGRASAIDDAGHLVVETASGARAVSAGDVVHLRPHQGRERDRGLG
jgi:BirA family biotin operon repressor/biotin-[acetyl-CoA-carboxylase] ligase